MAGVVQHPPVIYAIGRCGDRRGRRSMLPAVGSGGGRLGNILHHSSVAPIPCASPCDYQPSIRRSVRPPPPCVDPATRSVQGSEREVPVPAAPLVPGVPHGQRHVRGSGGGARADPDARAKPNRAGPRQGARGVRRSAEPEQVPGARRVGAAKLHHPAARTTTRPSCFVCQGP